MPAAGEKYRYKYDERGRLAEAPLAEHEGALIGKYVHPYDARGNRVKRTRLPQAAGSAVPQRVEYRTIEYF